MKKFDQQVFLETNQCNNFYDSTYPIVGRKYFHKDKGLWDFVKNTVKGKTLIDLGCSREPDDFITDFLFMGVNSYIGVEPFYDLSDKNNKEYFSRIKENILIRFDKDIPVNSDKINFVHRDALSYLENISSKRDDIVTFSSGLLDSSMINSREYAEKVINNISRICNKNPCAIHITDSVFRDMFDNQENIRLNFSREIPMNLNRIGIYSRV